MRLRAAIDALLLLGLVLVSGPAGPWASATWAPAARADDALAATAADGGYLGLVKPVFRQRCVACHGSLAQEAGLRLDTATLARQGAAGGPVIEPGAAAASPLVARITATDPEHRMPPEGSPLTPAETAAIAAWIDAGAAAPADERPEADPAEHWAFRPPVRPTVPRAGHPVDAFLDDRLAAADLPAGPQAPPHVRLRRLHLDLVGVPPTPAELEAFLADPSPTAWSDTVERLLADPRHGERHARHWMDVWRYADWYGRRHVPDVWNSAPQIWRWRDWIVAALNADKGYDRMVAEMLAGDEIAPDDRDAGHATGYLVRNWYALNPNDWMRANVEHTAKAFLGLTFHCAHCHDHKYDPISQDDYFRLRAFFEPLALRQDRMPGEADPGPFQEYEYSQLRRIQPLGAVRVFDRDAAAPTWFYTGGDERNRVTDRGSMPPGLPVVFAASLPPIEEVTLPAVAWYPALAADIQAACLADAEARVAAARAAVDATPAGDDDLACLRVEVARCRLAAAEAEHASVAARVAADRGRHADGAPAAEAAALVRRAARAEQRATLAAAWAEVAAQDFEAAEAAGLPDDDAARGQRLDAAVSARAAAVARVAAARERLADPAAADAYAPLGPHYPQASTGRRRALAAWITDRGNPLAARVAVNHVWMRHFHVPLVATVADFGRNGAPPSHPDLLDWLAVEFMESGWSLRHLHRLIVTSAAYGRDSGSGPQAAVDPDNRLLWRMHVGRMEAEVVRDSLLAVAGLLDPTMGGPPLATSEALSTHRRSLYYECFPEEGGQSAFARLFDAPDPLECYRRSVSIMPQQALALTNSELVHTVSERLVADAGASSTPPRDDDAAFVAAMFLRILARPPSPAEQAACLDALPAHRRLLEADGAADAAAGARRGLARVLLNHHDFLTIR